MSITVWKTDEEENETTMKTLKNRTVHVLFCLMSTYNNDQIGSKATLFVQE